MSLVKDTYERVKVFYAEALTQGIYRRESENNYAMRMRYDFITVEMLKRNFTKRQKSIISSVASLSLALGKERAVIPKLQDFEVCGLSKTKIRSELNKMVGMKVLSWNKEETSFSINPPTQWEVPYHEGYNNNRSIELFLINLQDAGIDVQPVRDSLNKINHPNIDLGKNTKSVDIDNKW